jgi:hypothetical protein
LTIARNIADDKLFIDSQPCIRQRALSFYGIQEISRSLPDEVFADLAVQQMTLLADVHLIANYTFLG